MAVSGVSGVSAGLCAAAPGYAIATGFATGLAFGAGIAVANSLWGNCDWNHGNVNVNRYNNINVNNRINANSNNVNWNRNDPRFSRNNVNRNNVNNNFANRQNNSNNQNLAANRDQFRGRNEQRAQAAQTLQQRTGQNMNQSATQRAQNIRSGGGTQREGGMNNSNLNQRAQNVNRDNALRGAGNAARQDRQRGQASRQAFQNQQGNRMGANGGGVERQGGGIQRPTGGGGGFGRFPPPLRIDHRAAQEPDMPPIQSNKNLSTRSLFAALAAAMFLAAPLAHAQAVYPRPDAAAQALTDTIASNDEAALSKVLGKDHAHYVPTDNIGEQDIYQYLGTWAQGHRIVMDDKTINGHPSAHVEAGTSG